MTGSVAELDNTPRPFLECQQAPNLWRGETFNRAAVAQVVERSPEKAGVGGSTPSRGTLISTTYNHPKTNSVPYCSKKIQLRRRLPSLGVEWLSLFLDKDQEDLMANTQQKRKPFIRAARSVGRALASKLVTRAFTEATKEPLRVPLL